MAQSRPRIAVRRARDCPSLPPFQCGLAWAIAALLLASPAEAQWRLGPPTLVVGEDTGALFGSVAGVFVRDDRIYVTDEQAQRIHAFNAMTGQIVASAGRRGKGPGDFELVGWVGDCGRDSVFVADDVLNRVTVFSLDLEFARTISLDGAILEGVRCVGPNGFVGIDRIESPIVAIDELPEESHRDDFDLVLFAPDGSVRRTIGRFPGIERVYVARPDGFGYSIVPLAWGLWPKLDTSPRGFVLGTGDAWSLTRFDAEGNVRDTLAVDESRIAVSRFHVDEYSRRAAARARDPNGTRRYYAEYPFPSHFPAYRDVRVSEDDFTWVMQFTAPYPEPRNHWKVFGPDGALAATADLPLGFVLKWVGETRVAGVAFDEMDTQRVELRPILR